MPLVYGKATRSLPTSAALDEEQVQPRLNLYGDTSVSIRGDAHSAVADEGSYYKAANPYKSSVGTAPAFTQIPGYYTTVGAAYNSTTPTFVLYNSASSGGKTIFLDYVRLIVAGATGQSSIASSATGRQCAVAIDTSIRITSTTGGNVCVPSNSNMSSPSTSVGVLRFGNVGTVSSTATALTVTAATGTQRTVARHSFQLGATASIAVSTGEQFSIDFGERSISSIPNASAGGAQQLWVGTSGPVALGAGHTLLFYMWYPSLTTGIMPMNFEIGWWER